MAILTQMSRALSVDASVLFTVLSAALVFSAVSAAVFSAVSAMIPTVVSLAITSGVSFFLFFQHTVRERRVFNQGKSTPVGGYFLVVYLIARLAGFGLHLACEQWGSILHVYFPLPVFPRCKAKQ